MTVRRLSMSYSLGAALLLASACSGGSKPSAPATGTSSPAAAARTVVTGSATAKTIHDGYAANGIACADCHPCGAAGNHALAWMDQTDSGFHGAAAGGGLASCQGCHGANLDGVGGSTTIACARCHGATWKTNCTMCHGGTDNLTGAPPRATWGNLDPTAVGAHTSHVAATHALSLPLDCASCHLKPQDALAAGHVDGAVTVTRYTGTNPAMLGSMTDPGWNTTTGTCATAYCHGATLQGGTLTTPSWTTLDGTQAACGTCHGIPPPTGRLAQIHYQGQFMTLHDLHIGTGYTCRACHPGYGADLTPNAAIHVNGAVDVGNWIKQWDPVTGSCSLSCHGSVVMQWR